MTELNAGDRVYMGGMGRFVAEQTIDGERMAGVVWDANPGEVVYVPYDRVGLVSDFAQLAVRAMREARPAPDAAGVAAGLREVEQDLRRIADEMETWAKDLPTAAKGQKVLAVYARSVRLRADTLADRLDAGG